MPTKKGIVTYPLSYDFKKEGLRFRFGHNRYVHPALRLFCERYGTVGFGKQGMILAEAYIGARVELGAALAHEDAACEYDFAFIALYAETFAC